MAVALPAINSITQDDDERQDLWVRWLEDGNSDIEVLSNHLAEIRRAYSEDQLLQITLWKRVQSVDQQALLSLFEQFSDLEQSVMRLLTIGATIEEISGITQIASIRLHHIIYIIRKHSAWDTFGKDL